MSITGDVVRMTTERSMAFVNTTNRHYYQFVCEDDNSTSAINTTDQSCLRDLPVGQIFMITSYVIICLCGLVGNGLVIYVVLRFAKMKTVTNCYILNLAISDVLFLFSLPFLVTTTIIKYWIFGPAMCRIYFLLFSINFFTGVFTLTAMSADRYFAVCHPVRSVNYRNPRIAFYVCVFIWTVSIFVMLPVFLYSTTVPHRNCAGKMTCTISWPENQPIPGDKAFTWYTFLLGFSIPIALISVFYVSVVLRLRSVGPSKKSKERKKSNRKVTRLVLAMISVYVICWLPYWCFQGHLTFRPSDTMVPNWQIYLFNAFTVLSFANSMLNPLLYAFLSEIFRKSFMKAFKCIKLSEMSRSTCAADNSAFPRSTVRKENGNEKFEFTSMINQTEDTCVNANNAAFQMTPLTADDKLQEIAETEPDENSKLYVDKEIQTKRNELP